ncbi:MAG: hypothetical protein CMJ45_10220 [Planctomyces sp.]|nr:hypothetical protein [Planctomyces sp.]
MDNLGGGNLPDSVRWAGRGAALAGCFQGRVNNNRDTSHTGADCTTHSRSDRSISSHHNVHTHFNINANRCHCSDSDTVSYRYSFSYLGAIIYRHTYAPVNRRSDS